MVTYEQWCAGDSKYWLAEAEQYNQWRSETKHTLLTDIGPRIAAVGEKGYIGCGFHYDMEKRFANLISNLAIPWQPSANHLDKIQDDFANTLVSKVLFESLVEDVEEAELTSKMSVDESQAYMRKKQEERARKRKEEMKL